VHGALAILAAGFVLVAGPCAAQSTATSVDESQIAPTAGSQTARPMDAGQISAPAAGSDISAGQIVATPRTAAIGANQLTVRSRGVDPGPSVSSPAQGRNTNVTLVKGHDRCDPAAGKQADSADCDQIIENRADEFAPPATGASASVVNTDAAAPDIVKDIVNGGTGTVVTLPKP
jgi:hypothetical protein